MNAFISTAAAKSIANFSAIAVNDIISKKYKFVFIREDIEDIVGDVQLKACAAFCTFNPDKGRLFSWVYTIAARAVLDAVDYKMKRASISYSTDAFKAVKENWEPKSVWGLRGDEYDAVKELEISEMKEEILRIADGFTDKYREMVYMLFDELTPSEMAEITHERSETLMVRASRVRAKLSEYREAC